MGGTDTDRPVAQYNGHCLEAQRWSLAGREEHGHTKTVTRGLQREGDETIVSELDGLSLSDGHETREHFSTISSEGSDSNSNSVSDLPFVIEIYGFDESLKTRDILRQFQGYGRSEFCVKWVNDTHALGIFASERQGGHCTCHYLPPSLSLSLLFTAWLAAGAVYKGLKTRMVREGIPESIALAEKLASECTGLRNTHIALDTH